MHGSPLEKALIGLASMNFEESVKFGAIRRSLLLFPVLRANASNLFRGAAFAKAKLAAGGRRSGKQS
jgi:hypothetical protein